jgi:hypothetical protein
VSIDYEQSHGEDRVRARHRVALELEVDRGDDEVDPEDWDLEDLVLALTSGQARPLRTIQGLVVDAEHDRLSTMLDAVAGDLEETAELQWLTSATKHPAFTRRCHGPRPTLEVLVDLQGLATWARRVAWRLEEQGL